MTVDAIKDAISGLPDEERHSLAMWLNELEYDDWDKQMAADFTPSGRGAALVEKVKHHLSEGVARPIAEGFASRDKSRK